VEWALLGPSTGTFADADARKSFDHFEGRNPPIVEMAELLDRHEIQRVDFLKCDIEGSEFDLFFHGAEWLSRVRRLAMEVHPAFGSPLALRDLLTRRGFAVSLQSSDLAHDSIDGRGGFLYATAT
jgi:hypothetical protein